jgi:DNA-binding transcriptional regulator GbsR (MarR family)
MEVELDPLATFFQSMDSIHQKLGYRKHYVAILLTIIMEKEGISQDRIRRITKIPLGPTSEILELLISQGFITKIKRPKEREKIYRTEISLEDFFLKITDRLAQSYEIIQNKVAPIHQAFQQLIEKEPKLKENSQIIHFHVLLSLYYTLVEKGIKIMHNLNRTDISPTLNENQIDQIGQDLEQKWGEFFNNITQMNSNLLETHILKEFQAIKVSFYNHLNDLMEGIGFTKGLGSLLFGLWAMGKECTQEQLAQEIGRSRSSISGDLKKLTKLRYVTWRKYPNDRKIYYKMQSTILSSFFQKMKALRIYSRTVVSLAIQYQDILEDPVREIKNRKILQFLKELIETFEKFDRYNLKLYSEFAQQVQTIAIPDITQITLK